MTLLDDHPGFGIDTGEKRQGGFAYQKIAGTDTPGDAPPPDYHKRT
jgi:hypothetical protein